MACLFWVILTNSVLAEVPGCRRALEKQPILFNQPDVFIVTHQTDRLELRTVKLLTSEVKFKGVKFSSVPVIVLAEATFPIHTRALQTRATYIAEQYTEYQFGPTVRRVHLAGGYADMCLSCTATDAVRKVLNLTDAGSLILVAHSSLIYERADKRTLQQGVLSLPDHLRASAALEKARDLVFDTSDFKNFFLVSQWEPLDLDRVDYEYLFVRPSDGKMLTIRLIE